MSRQASRYPSAATIGEGALSSTCRCLVQRLGFSTIRCGIVTRVRHEPHHGHYAVAQAVIMASTIRTTTMSSVLRSRSYGSIAKESMTSSSPEAITVDHENALNVSVSRLKEWSELRA